MELRQLRYFVTVVEEASFTRAAARLHLAQPGVSAQVRQLERELGQPLLHRSGRTVTPTEVGAAVLPYARAALAAAEGVRDTVAECTGLLRGQVRIGFVSGAAAQELDVAGVLADFHDAHPGVDIALTEDTSERMRTALADGELDIAVIGLTGADLGPHLAHEVIVDMPLVAAATPDDPLLATAPETGGLPLTSHPLTAPSRTAPPLTSHPLTAPPLTGLPLTALPLTGLPLTALRDRPLISLPRGTGIRGVLDRACAAAGFAPRIAFEAAAPELLARLAARGLGVAVVPELAPDEQRRLGLRTAPFADPALRGRVALAWPTGGPSGPAARALLQRLRLDPRTGRDGCGNLDG